MENFNFSTLRPQNQQSTHSASNENAVDNQITFSVPINCQTSQYEYNLRLATEDIFASDHQDNSERQLNAESNTGQLAPISLEVNSQKHQEFFNDLQIILEEQFKKSQQKKLRKTICKNKHTCAICHQKVRRKSIVYRLTCRHIFHSKCLDKWKVNKNSCPLCRKQLV